MSSKTLKRWGTACVQTLIVLGVLAATVMVLSTPDCRVRLLAETFCGVVAGLYGGLLHALQRIVDAIYRDEPTDFLGTDILAELIRDLKEGFLGGWLFGLTVGVWQFFRC